MRISDWSSDVYSSDLLNLSTTAGSRSERLVLLPTVPVPHALGYADHCRVIGRHLVLVGELVCPLHRLHPATGPLPVVRDEQQCHVADGSSGPDESLHTAAVRDPLVKVLLVGRVGRATKSEKRQ